jgi:hypothetical protein
MNEVKNEVRMYRGGSGKGKTISFDVTLEESQVKKINRLFKSQCDPIAERQRRENLVNMFRAMDGMKPLK